jgi:hypothetical protein
VLAWFLHSNRKALVLGRARRRTRRMMFLMDQDRVEIGVVLTFRYLWLVVLGLFWIQNSRM